MRQGNNRLNRIVGTILRLIRRASEIIVVLAVLLAGCGGGGDDDVNVASTFRGTLQDNSVGTGTVTATLAQDGNDLTGTYQTMFPLLIFNSSGRVTGEVQGHDV